MTNDPRGGIRRLREQIRESAVLTDRDRENLLAFSDQLDLLKSEYSDQRHEKLLRHCTIMAGQAQRIDQDDLPDIELSAALEDRDTADRMLRWINDRYDSEESNRDYRVALRMFGQRLAEAGVDIETDSDGVPVSVEHIPTTTSRNYNPTPDPAKMLKWEDDVLALIDGARNARDAALIAVAWDAGTRGFEIPDLTVGSVTDSRHGLKLTVDGKTGQRSILLVPSVPYLNKWLGEHPARDDESAPLWSKLNEPEQVSYQLLRKAVRTAADRAGVDKPVTFTNFRKSQAAHLASRGVKEAIIKERLGWSQGSNIASRYVSVFDEDSDRQIAAMHGKDVEQEEPEPIAPKVCPRCDKENPRDGQQCSYCGQLLDVGAAKDVRAREQEVRRAVLRLVTTRPELLGEIEAAEDMWAIFEDRPELKREAEALAAELAGDD